MGWLTDPEALAQALLAVEGLPELFKKCRLSEYRDAAEVWCSSEGVISTAELTDYGLWDELILYLAPKLMGPGRSLLHSPEIDNMGDLAAHEIVSVSQLDQDLRVIVRPGVAEVASPF